MTTEQFDYKLRNGKFNEPELEDVFCGVWYKANDPDGADLRYEFTEKDLYDNNVYTVFTFNNKYYRLDALDTGYYYSFDYMPYEVTKKNNDWVAIGDKIRNL